jgi:hypothetical protein
MFRLPTRLLPTLLIACLLTGCPPKADLDPPGDSGWVALCGDDSPVSWGVVMGTVRKRPEAMVLLGRDSKAIALARNVDRQDGEFEFVVLEDPESSSAGPYTLSLRAAGSILDWRALYVVIRPDSVELVRGSTNDQTPGASMRRRLQPPGQDQARTWRIRLDGADVQIFLDGVQVARFEDPRPEPGTIGVTADGTDIKLLDARYRPLIGPIDRPGDI